MDRKERREGGRSSGLSTYVYLLGLDLEGETFQHALGGVAEDVVAEEAHAVRCVELEALGGEACVCGWEEGRLEQLEEQNDYLKLRGTGPTACPNKALWEGCLCVCLSGVLCEMWCGMKQSQGLPKGSPANRLLLHFLLIPFHLQPSSPTHNTQQRHT